MTPPRNFRAFGWVDLSGKYYTPILKELGFQTNQSKKAGLSVVFAILQKPASSLNFKLCRLSTFQCGQIGSAKNAALFTR
jgi:hypothetical protein